MKLLINSEKAKKILIKLLTKLQLKEEEAKTIIDCYIEADLCGVNTHGISVLPAHIDKIINHVYNIKPNIRIEREGISFSVVNGDNSIGPISASYCMNLAIRNAKEKGIYFVFCNNNNTLGPAFYYNNLAICQGLIGITITNSPATMAPTNGKSKLLGTNPLAISIPAKNENPIILDMATSTVAKSKIKQALEENKTIPLDWATDINGIPTENPEEAIKGLLLPMAGYKGYGIAMMIDIIAGLLSSAGYLNRVGKFYDNNQCMNVGYSFIVLNPVQIYGDNFYEEMDKYIRIVKSSESIDDKKIILPGENRIQNKKRNIQEGIEVEEQVIDKLDKFIKKYGIEESIR